MLMIHCFLIKGNTSLLFRFYNTHSVCDDTTGKEFEQLRLSNVIPVRKYLIILHGWKLGSVDFLKERYGVLRIWELTGHRAPEPGKVIA